jgi:hypothetical protein
MTEKNLFQNPDLLDNFLDEMLAFQTDRSQEVCLTGVSHLDSVSPGLKLDGLDAGF